MLTKRLQQYASHRSFHIHIGHWSFLALPTDGQFSHSFINAFFLAYYTISKSYFTSAAAINCSVM